MPKKWDMLSLPKDRRWDMGLWPDSEIDQWMYAIEVRSDELISQGMHTGNWEELEGDQRTYDKLKQEKMKRGSFWGYRE